MLVQDIDSYRDFIKELSEGPPVLVYDLETTGLDPFKNDRMIGVAALIPGLVNGKQDQSFYIPFRHATGKNLPIEELYHLAPFLTNPDRGLIGHNIKFDVHFTQAEGITVYNQCIDTMVAAHLNNENESTLTLKGLGTKYIDPSAADADKELQQKLKDRKLKKGQMWRLSPEEVSQYAEQDVKLTWALAKFYQTKLAEQGIEYLWSEVNTYLKAVLTMENRGVLINPGACLVSLNQAHEHRDNLYAQMVKIVGKDFNPNSVPQLRKILNQKETDRNALAKSTHPIAKKLVEYRSWVKASGTFYQGFLDLMDENCRVHPNLNLTGTISSRLSCSKPNLQALPKKNDIYKVRDLVVAPPGYKLMAWDWSQIELRLLAHYTKDPFLIDTYINRKDMHGETAKGLGIDRDKAKRTNFSIVYGIGKSGLASELGISENEAGDLLNKYYSMIPGVKKLYNTARKIAETNRQIPMWTGRIRHYREEDQVYKGMSHLIQGGVAEMMRIAITKLHDRLIGTRAHMNLQVHDEILFEIPEEEENYWAKHIKKDMEDFNFAVPIVAEGKVGYNWGDMEPIEINEEDE